MHKHLERQIRRAGGLSELDLAVLLEQVDQYYEQNDKDRRMWGHSTQLMSDELNALSLNIQQRSEARFQGVFNAAADAILTLNTNLRVDTVNQAALTLFGHHAQQIQGMAVQTLLTRRLKGEAPTYPPVNPLDPSDRQLYAITRSGKRVPVELTTGIMQNEHETLTIVALRDISERLESERQRTEYTAQLARSNAELEHFAYIVSHDLQQPLHTIAVFIQLLRRKHGSAFNEEAQEYFTLIETGARRMGESIQGLLHYSRIQGSTLRLENIDLNDVLQNVLVELNGSIEFAHANVTVHPLPEVVADGGLIGRVLLNLVGNSLKFTNGEPPRVEISADDDAEFWVVCVRDYGMGIPPKYREQIFDMFQRLHSDDVIPGNGIGLAICKKIIQAHGGKIWVSENTSPGTEFKFSLPKRYLP